MINILFAFLFTSMSFSLFTMNYQVSGVNRNFLGMPVNYFEVATLEENGTFYFDQDLLKEKINGYLDVTISRYVKSYQTSFSYYNQEDNSYCINEQCTKVVVNLSADLAFSIHYNKSMFYAIKGA